VPSVTSETDDKAFRISESLSDALDALMPGEALRVTRESDGTEFVLINFDDFEHICDVAGLRTRVLEGLDGK
jgi:hypothetical protein